MTLNVRNYDVFPANVVTYTIFIAKMGERGEKREGRRDEVGGGGGGVRCFTSSGGSRTSPRVDRETTRGPPAGGAAAAVRSAYRVRCAALRSNPHGSGSMGDPTTKI
jgi:hypothetical protein